MPKTEVKVILVKVKFAKAFDMLFTYLYWYSLTLTK